MDESWRMRMGTPASHRRRPSSSSSRSVFTESENLGPEDFSDVFGGPPRSVFWRKKSGGGGGSSFYEEIFRPPEIRNSGEYIGRGLPAFRIPGLSERFYSDVFGSEPIGEDRRSRERSRTSSKAKSKSTSSSVLSSEEVSPLRAAIGDHVAFSDLASKLRPINVPSRRNSSTSTTTMHNKNDTLTCSSRKQKAMPYFNTTNNSNRSTYVETTQFMETTTTTDHQSHWSFGKSHHPHHHHHFGFSRRVSSPETISLEPDSYPSVKISVEDAELNSPSSVVSSVCHESNMAKSSESRDCGVEDNDSDSDEDDEIMSSYVIEIGYGSDHREGTCDAIGIDEAIAWAKEKFQTYTSSEKDLNNKTQEDSNNNKDQSSNIIDRGASNVRNCTEQQMDNKNEVVQNSPKMEMTIQDENIRLWSFGKEADIRLLLSTLHYILWKNSGWSAIPLASLIDSSQVKKAYQKARLCLHPDKLQQRGATLPQKYIADKAFSILQDAWASFISQDVSFTS